MESIVVSEQEINNIEALLLSNNHQFASDAREVIRCWESKDVAACPGSGKTTILLAKLKILYDRMPLENNAGVCVLSHTNVAVDEIKTRLSDCADKLMGYPNYVGTIQSFIDRFVVTPYLKKLTNTAIQVVDNEIYTQHLLSIIAKQRKYNKLLFFFRKQYENSHYDNLFDFCKDVQLKSGALYVGKQRRAMAGKASDSAKLYTQAIDELLQTEGMIRYKDAYTYTHEAIEALTTEYTDLFCKRFSYVFIDEYQDCNKNQRDALDKIFNPSKCYHGQIQYARVFQNRKQFDQFFHGLEDKYAFHKLWLDTKVREHLAFMLIYFGYFNTIPLMVKRIPLPVGQELTDEEMETVCNQILFILGASFDGEMNQLMSELDERIVDSVYKLDLNRPKKSMMRKNMDNMDMKYCMKRLSTRTVLGKSQENIFRLIMDIVYKEKNIDESKMSDQEYDDFIKSAAPKVYDEIKSDIEAFDQKLQQFAKDNGIKKGKLSEGDLPDEGYSITLRELLEGKEPISNTERKKRMGQ